MADRVPRVRGRLEDFDVDGILLSALPAIRWACGFTGTNGLLLVTEHSAYFITDGRYTEQARSEVEGAEVGIASEGLMKGLLEAGVFETLDSVVLQADDVTVAAYQQIKEEETRVDWRPKPEGPNLRLRLEDESVVRLRLLKGGGLWNAKLHDLIGESVLDQYSVSRNGHADEEESEDEESEETR